MPVEEDDANILKTSNCHASLAWKMHVEEDDANLQKTDLSWTVPFE